MKRSRSLKRQKPLARGRTRLKARRVPKAFRQRRDAEYAAWIRERPCLLWVHNGHWANEPRHYCTLGSVQVCHVKSRGAGGDDCGNLWPGCAGAHEEQHRIGIPSFQARWRIDLKAEATRLYQQYQQEAGL